jgi:hypothetical protein
LYVGSVNLYFGAGPGPAKPQSANLNARLERTRLGCRASKRGRLRFSPRLTALLMTLDRSPTTVFSLGNLRNLWMILAPVKSDSYFTAFHPIHSKNDSESTVWDFVGQSASTEDWFQAKGE